LNMPWSIATSKQFPEAPNRRLKRAAFMSDITPYVSI
jgi:hypothetical protein